ncbi:hypothetical protein GOODEAATRI_010004 [Goodea atripinnis]|uniref:Sterol regulatory element-binding protein cleavage-activating protein n=1 Tax=Goodea atripinnis TaxID=208336 RepID=A0ABV0N035_9TELE
MKNMATELCIILIGYFTLVPAIQEFCLFAVVGLVSDFFLQMFFFTTVLSIDIRRMEAGTVIWIGILAYTDPAGIRTYLAAQVSEQSPLGDPGGGGLNPHLAVAPVFRGGDPTSTLSIHSAPDPTPLPENQSQGHLGPADPLPHALPSVPQITWGGEDEEGWRKLSFRHWPSLFSYYNITLAKKYISLLPVIPVTIHLSPQEAIDTRHPQDTRHPPPLIPKASADTQTDLTLYKVAALGLAAGVLLVLLLFCLYRVLCPRNYGRNGVTHGRRRRGDLPCDDYGYSPPVSEISPLLLRGHSMVRRDFKDDAINANIQPLYSTHSLLQDIECLASDGMLLASCCLAGQIRVWDAQTGDCLTVIPKQELRRCNSSGCWEQRDVWDTMSGAAESECACESRDLPIGCDGISEEDCYPLRRRIAPIRPPLFTDQPDLTPLIDTNFTSQPPSNLSTPPRGGFDFGGLVERAYMEHEPPSPSTYPSPSSTSSSPPSATQLQRSPSLGDTSGPSNQERGSGAGTQSAADWESSVWAMELRGNLIAAGRSSGKLEVCETSYPL